MAASAKPNKPIPAPRAEMTRPADYWEHIADISSGDIDLRERQFGGNHSAQLVRLNNTTAGNLVAVLIQECGEAMTPTSQSITVNAGAQYEIPRPIRKIVASGSGALQADVFWWCASNSMPNP
jgi:hypothetical protein